jgi:hypothetical protein
MKKALAEYENANRIKDINQELYDHLTGSIYYLVKYCVKYDIPLPNRENLIGMVTRANAIIQRFATPTSLKQPYKTTDNETKSKKLIKFRNSQNFFMFVFLVC